MRSKIKGIVFRVACFSILILGVCAFGLYKSFAASAPFAIDGVEVTQKSDAATGDVTGVVGNRINNNVTFHKVGDSVTYRIKIKNVSGSDRIIENVNSNYQGELFAYEFNSYAGDTIAADETFDFVLKTTYANAVSDITKRQQNLEIKFVFKFSDGSEMTIVIANPSTWDNISVFGVIFASCIIGLLAVVVLRCRRMAASKKVVISGILLAVACVPFPFVNAADGTYDVAIANNYTLEDELLVRFIGKDGSEEITTETIAYEDLATSAAAPDVEGYHFDGWKTEDGEVFDFSTPITEDLTLYAEYAPYTYNVQFDGNGATSGTMNAQTLTYDKEEELYANGFARAGYDFVGWNVAADGSGQGYLDKESVENLRNEPGIYKLFAIWSVRNDTQYTVVDKYMTVNGEGYDVVTRPELTTRGTTDTKVTPLPIGREGFVSPTPQTKVITGDGLMKIEYEYARVKKTLTIQDAEFVTTSHASGEYNYGTEVTLKAKERDGWKFEKWSNGATDEEITITLNSDTTIKPIYKEGFKLVYSHDGACTFNGNKSSSSGENGLTDADYISGDDCDDYSDQKYIDTGVRLYSEENAHKDFLVEFSIDEFDLSKNGNRATLLNSTFENSSAAFPGIVVRRNDNQDKLLIGVNVVKDKKKTVDSKTYFAPISSVSKVRIMRKNDAICYAINDEAPVYVGDNSPHNYYFDAPSVMFGASVDYKTPSSPTPYRFFNGTLSGMKIRLGTDVDDTLNCEKP